MTYPYSFGKGALQLFDNGYRIAPLVRGERYPKNIIGWNDPYLKREKVIEWTNEYKRAGIVLVTGEVIAVDIDIYNEQKVNTIVEWCFKNIGISPIRIGRAPKCCLFYRTDEDIGCFRSAVYRDCIDSSNMIEVLGKGRSISIYGRYPDLKLNKNYDWLPEADGLLNIPLTDLKPITREQIHELLTFYESEIPSDWVIGSKQQEIGCSATAVDDLQSMAKLIEHSIKLPFIEDTWKDILGYLDPDCDMATWLHVGMGLHHEFDGSPIGFKLWYEWSCGSPKSESVGNWDAKWKSFVYTPRYDQNTGELILPKTGKFIRTLAVSRGWKELSNAEESQELKVFDSKKKSNPSTIDDFLNRFIFIVKGSRVFDTQKPFTDAINEYQEFVNEFAAFEHEYVNAEGKPKAVPLSKWWIRHENRITVQGTVFSPGQELLIRGRGDLTWINTFHFPIHENKTEGDGLKVFFDHMEYLMPFPEEREWFISWIAHKIQYPHIKQQVTPLHISTEHGTGRGWIVKLLFKLFGEWNCSKTTIQELSGKGSQFNAYLIDKLICVIEEVRDNKKYSVSHKIRSFLTDEYQYVNDKGKQQATIRIFVEFFLQCNDPDSWVLDEVDRRINALSGPSKIQPQAYYDKLYAWLNSCNVGALFHYLKNKDLSSFNWKRSMNTQAREELILNSRSELEQLFLDYIVTAPRKIMTLEEIEKGLCNLCVTENLNTPIVREYLTRIIGKHLRRAPYIKIEGNRRRYWITDKNFPPTPEAVRAYLNITK